MINILKGDMSIVGPRAEWDNLVLKLEVIPILLIPRTHEAIDLFSHCSIKSTIEVEELVEAIEELKETKEALIKINYFFLI